MGSLAEIISAFELYAGTEVIRIAALIVRTLGALFLVWAAFQLLGYYRAWAFGNSTFFDMALYWVRTMILLVLVLAYLLV
ncbi:MAG: DUF3262 family protein [Candidatus Thiodiazotropha sp. (ex Lucinoma borealis)]|nr:DUF3262 family protein [Candidatus Thiodiazotropha sp. (ex Lucinoma borealis)]MCU7865418.1 DUF3262 family protein [Candidatus Thiodiazotropha sp. (ex Lucinoma borealis)]